MILSYERVLRYRFNYIANHVYYSNIGYSTKVKLNNMISSPVTISSKMLTITASISIITCFMYRYNEC